MFGLPRFRYRTVRRILLLLIIATVVFFARYIQDVIYDARHPKTPPPPDRTVTMTRTIYPHTCAKQQEHETLTLFVNPTSCQPMEPTGVPPALKHHEYRQDGLLEVNPDGAHPIFELIERGETLWKGKLSRASKSLDEGVAEYLRRYKRPPPLGFDSWWFYVEENDIQLPDEYDQIHRDLEHFWGIDPVDLAALQFDWEAHRDSYTIGKIDDGEIELLNFTLPEDSDHQDRLLEAGFDIIDLLEDVQRFIPPFRAVFSPHDNPTLHTDYELKTMMLQAAKAGKYIDLKKPPPVKLEGWIAACAPTSLARRDPIDQTNAAPQKTKKTFIYDHARSMEPCFHPSHLVQHGQFLSHNKGPVPHRFMVPQFSYSPTLLHHDIITPNYISWVEDIDPRSDDPEWDDKINERLLWRGANTGIWHSESTRWREAQRARLVHWAAELNGTVRVLPPDVSQRDRVGGGMVLRKARVNPSMLDVAFAGEPLSCTPELCQQLSDTFEFRARQNYKAAGNYKYVIDVDGNGWSSRFKRLITSNSLVFKSTIYPEWYTDRIAPWVHYVPVQVDLSDLYDSLTFFRGDLHGKGAHDDLARKIAMAGREWSKTFWREEDMTAYLFRLFLEYARVMSPDRNAMSYQESHNHW